jgi:Solitary outer membrane autotransporter beta-barrel domain
MKKLILTITFLVLSFAFAQFAVFIQSASAQSGINIDDIIPDFNQEQRKALGNAFGVYTSATTVFTGLNSISGGSFTFDAPDGYKDSDLSVFRLPVSYSFGDEGDKYRLEARGVVGYFKSTSSLYAFSDALKQFADQLPPEINNLPNQADFRKDEALSLSAGMGLQMEPVSGLKITPAFDLIWTHIKRSFDYNNILSGLFGVKYDRDIFNTSLEAISYVPSMKVGYDIVDCDTFKITPSVEYSHIFTEDLWSKSSLADFSTDAGVLRSTLEGQFDTSLTVGSLPLGLHPYVIRTDLSGAAHESIGLSYFHDVGLDFTFDTKTAGWVLSQLKVGGAYIFGEDFSGYRVGLSGSF